ncbi:MAG: isochorismatase family protein [Nitrososphaerales archaeon]
MDQSYWSDVIPESDLKAYGPEKRMGFGNKLAILVVDVWYQAVEDYPGGWDAVHKIQTLLDSARSKSIPVVYSTVLPRIPGYPKAGISLKASGGRMDWSRFELVKEVAPKDGDIVIRKWKASIFHETPLISILNYHHIDTVICVGEAASGCLRATAIDAASYNYRTIIPVECAFDRSYVPQKVSLFDLDKKYADVIPLEDVLNHLAKL